jgi:hypothetical protein
VVSPVFFPGGNIGDLAVNGTVNDLACCGARPLYLTAGFILAILINWGLGFVSFSWFPSFDIFLKNGKLTALYLRKTVLINMSAVFGILLLAVWFPACRLSRSPLPRMLNGDTL